MDEHISNNFQLPINLNKRVINSIITKMDNGNMLTADLVNNSQSVSNTNEPLDIVNLHQRNSDDSNLIDMTKKSNRDSPINLQHQQNNNNSAKNKKLFPQKLWDLIHDERYNFCLRWSEDGQLVYLNRDEFEDSYLKTSENQFHTQKAISFVRQMNMYGFRKVDDCYYENDNFKRDCEHLLKNMTRKHPNKNLGSHGEMPSYLCQHKRGQHNINLPQPPTIDPVSTVDQEIIHCRQRLSQPIDVQTKQMYLNIYLQILTYFLKQ